MTSIFPLVFRYWSKKKPLWTVVPGAFEGFWRRPTLTPFTAIPSALAGLTALFGMGRGVHRRYRHQEIVMT